ncbi:hypothetical protein LP419_33230 [Massilia sp. H-1]|nr:hypothetical protein LP419_33230 [Massilia sp. H-1]
MAVKRRNVSLGEFIERFTRVVKMPHPELRPASLADIMDDILWLNREPCKSRGIEIGWLRRDDVPLQRLDSHLMEQALLNIVKNAVEAVETTQAESGKPGTIQFSLSQEGERVRLAVIDSGNRLGEVLSPPAVHAVREHQERRPGHRPHVRARSIDAPRLPLPPRRQRHRPNPI